MSQDHALYAEKLHQAQQLLEPADLWLVATRENLEQPEPALALVSGAHLTWDTFFLLSRTEAVAIAGRFDAPSITGAWRVISYDEDYAQVLRYEVERMQPRRILLNFAPDNPLCDGLTHGMFLNIQQALPGSSFDSAIGFVSKLRSIKTPAEQQRIRAAIDRAELHLEAALAQTRLGWSEYQVAQLMHGLIRAEGLGAAWAAEGCPNVSFARWPSHAGPTDKLLEPGMLIHTDYGVKMDGYCSDVQRIYYWPKPGEGIPLELSKAFETVWKAIDTAAQALKPGAMGYEVDAAARAVITGAGYPEYKYGTGHNVGRAVHDGGALLAPRWPRYGQAPEGQVEVGQIYTLELGVMLDGIGYVGLEEDVLVGPSGVEWLSRRQNQIYMLG